MKMTVIKEAPAFTLQGSSYNGVGELVEVRYDDLHFAGIGKMWEGRDNHNCGRALNEESAEVIYKTNHGCAVLFRSWGTTDSTNPERWKKEPKLVWYEFV